MFERHSQLPLSRDIRTQADNLDDSDVWAIGVITYFLLCGYTPFDRDSNLEEMQAILVADYSFTPLEYWRSVSVVAREFIKRCLTVDPHARMTAHEALSHPFVDWDKRREMIERGELPGQGAGVGGAAGGIGMGRGGDLLPTVKKNFNARRTLHAAIDTIRAINKLREGGAAGLMDGAMSIDPRRQGQPQQQTREQQPDTDGGGGGGGGGDQMEGVQHHGAGTQQPQGPAASVGAFAKQFDPRGNARGQTEEMIRAQQKRIEETARGLWNQGQRAMGR